MKSFLAGLFTCAALCANAQSFKLSGSIGYAQPMQSAGGYLLALEPKIVVSPTVDVGVRVEAARLMRSVKPDGSALTTNARFLGSYLATGNYRLSQGKFQSFVGAGAGIYHMPQANNVTVIYNQSPDDILFPDAWRFGGMIRYGIKTGHYLASLEYNAVLSSPLYRSATLVKSPNSYLSIKIGYEVGGYKKSTPAKP